MRRLSPKELTNGLFVQCFSPSVSPMRVFPVIYEIIIIDGNYFYRERGCDWVMPGNLVMDVWAETSETISLNRESKLDSLLPNS